MLTFAPSQHHETVTHILYSLDVDNEHKKLRHIHTYRSLSRKLTRVIRSAFWTTPHGPIAAVYDEANSHVVRNILQIFVANDLQKTVLIENSRLFIFVSEFLHFV